MFNRRKSTPVEQTNEIWEMLNKNPKKDDCFVDLYDTYYFTDRWKDGFGNLYEVAVRNSSGVKRWTLRKNKKVVSNWCSSRESAIKDARELTKFEIELNS